MDDILGEVLYTGSETRVVRARHPKSGALVVLKHAREDVPAREALKRLEHEYSMLRALEVPGVIRAVGLEPHGHGVSLLLEAWGDVSLDRALAQGPLPVGVALRLSASLARALGEVHRRGVIHRDVKPQNILIDADRSDVRLIDFGTAIRWTRSVNPTTSVDALAGTLAYMAPEQTGRMNRAVDARADLYALGATLYEMLTGALPFDTGDPIELIHAHIARMPQAPHERAPERGIPEAVSAIVLKLMANSPEHRYQTAGGAAFDLERAARQWAEAQRVSPFELATRDWQDSIRKPSRLFGREHESAALEEAFHKARGGAVVLALVGGPSGMGKSALVQALRGEVRSQGGVFAPGKFDQLQRSIPYSALAQALRSVVQRRLGDPAPVLERWRQAWQEAAGPNGQILVDMMPELVHILGEPKPLIEVGMSEAKNRFQMTVQRFARATATAEHPLLLFIDDLQWADPASMVLLQEIVTDPGGGHLLVVGAYRSDEVSASHPLHRLIDAAAEKGVATELLSLSPLGQTALSAMVADMLDGSAGETEDLSRLVKEKTDGSPFFVGQFLRALHEQGLLSRSSETGRWGWQQEAIERAGITDNVVTLLLRRLMELSPALQGVLQTAACVGNKFDLELVAHLEARSVEPISSLIEEAVSEGLLLPEDEADHAYTFVHDRVQQAAYEARAPEERLAAHLLIGRKLRARYGVTCSDDELFVTLHHRNLAAALLTEAEERRDLAEQNLRAGQRAKTSTAYTEAAGFLRVGAALLGEAGWTEAEELTFETHLGLAEVATLAGQESEGDALFQRCIERARDPIERARVVAAWLPLLTVAGHRERAVDLGLDALEWLGCPLPRTPESHAALLGQILEEIGLLLSKMPPAGWKTLSKSEDRAHQLVCEILISLVTCAALARPSLSPCCTLLVARETLRHGIVKNSASGLALTAVFMTYVVGQLPPARWLIDAAVDMLEQYDVQRTDTIHFIALAYQYLIPLRQATETFYRAGIVGAEEGVISQGEYADLHSYYTRAIAGAYLPDVLHAARERTYRDNLSADIRAIIEQSLDALIRRADSDAGGADVERALDAAFGHAWSASMMTFYSGAMAGWVGLHLGADRWAARTIIAAEPLWPTSWGNAPLLVCTWTLCIACTMCLLEATDEERSIWEEKLAFHGERLASWSESCPQTFRHMRLLTEAGRARLRGEHDKAEGLYEEAIEDARKNGFVSGEALGLRLAGEHRLALGKNSYARACLREAHDAYVRWGAFAAAARIRERHPDLIPLPTLGSTSPAEATAHPGLTQTTATSEEQISTHIDVESVLRASQTIASDRDLRSLVGRMLRLLVENAGAERAVLALVQGGLLRVSAELTVEPEQVELDLSEPIDGSTRLPGTLVQYVARGQEPVVLGQAISDSRFDDDPYLRAHRPASILAVPLVHQGRLSGVMYLEHHAVNAFPESRVGLVALLASQAATAVENTMMYTALAASHERLELLVEERTAQLKTAKEAADKANRAKSDFLASMSHELRTPLNSILGYTQLLERMQELPTKGHHYADIIHKSGEHLLTLINDLLDLAKIEAGKIEMVPAGIDLRTTIQGVYSICRVRAEQKNLSLTYEIAGPELSGVVLRVDERRLMQVLLNLLGNAVKFTEKGGVLLRVTVSEGAEAGERAVRFDVRDTGQGIAPEHLARIFDPFEQVGDRRARREGTGLGLAISKRIVEQMGGSIDVESQLGKGSVFTVMLRLPEASATAASAEPSWSNIEGYKGERRRILIVDDSRENRGLLREMFLPIGFEIAEAEDGEQALRAAAEWRPDLIVMDLAMPGMNGYETTRQLRRNPELASIPIIASSASVSSVERDESMNAGCNGFLPKPLQASAIVDVLERHLHLEWIRKEGPGRVMTQAPPGGAESGALTPPPAADTALLLDLVRRGRLRNLLEELHRLEQSDPGLGPWVTSARALAKSFNAEKLRDFLLAHSSAGAERPV